MSPKLPTKALLYNLLLVALQNLIMKSIYELRFLQHPINLGTNKSRSVLEVQLLKCSRVKIMMNAIPRDWTLEILFTNPI